MGDDDSLLFRADENSQSGASFPESGTSLQSVVSHHVTHATHAAIGKEDSGDISHCEHSLSNRLSSLLASCVCPHQETPAKYLNDDGSIYDAHTKRPRRRQNDASHQVC